MTWRRASVSRLRGGALGALVAIAACRGEAPARQQDAAEVDHAEARPERPRPAPDADHEGDGAVGERPALPAATGWAFMGPPDPALAAAIVKESHRVSRLIKNDEGTELSLSGADLEEARRYAAKRLPSDDEESQQRLSINGKPILERAWVDRRIAEAKRGHASVVRLPLIHCIGWGCETPSPFTAVHCFDGEQVFIHPVGNESVFDACGECYRAKRQEQRDECAAARCEGLVVEGYFTGELKRRSSPDCVDDARVFHVLRGSATVPRRFGLGLAAGSPPPEGAPIDEGPAFGVIASSTPRWEPGAREQAERSLERVKAAGFAEAELVDSRRLPAFWCCSWVVLVERFDQREEARRLQRELSSKGLGAGDIRRLY